MWQGCGLQKDMIQLLLPHLQWLMWQCLQMHIFVCAAALPGINCTQDGLFDSLLPPRLACRREVFECCCAQEHAGLKFSSVWA